MRRRRHGDYVLARHLDLVAGLETHQLARQPAAIEPGEQLEDAVDPLDGLFGQVDCRGLHLHHPAPGDVNRQGRHMIEMRVRDKPAGRAHERPGMCPQVETELEFRNAPIRLHRRARVPLDGQTAVRNRLDGGILDHMDKSRSEALRFAVGRSTSPSATIRRSLNAASMHCEKELEEREPPSVDKIDRRATHGSRAGGCPHCIYTGGWATFLAAGVNMRTINR